MFISVHPGCALQPFVESIWYCNRQVGQPEQTRTLPFGRMELVFRFSGSYRVRSKDMDFDGEDMWVSGQQTGSTITTISGRHECMGVVFTKLGWSGFSKIEASELKNRSIPLSEIFGKEFNPLRNELHGTNLPEAKIQLLENFLLKRLVALPNLSTIKQVLHIIRDSEDVQKITVNYLCKILRISRKSLNIHFQKYIGLPASSYLQQSRLNRIIRDINDRPNERLIETGYEYDFFDQAHFTKAFRSFSGISPSQYLHFVRNDLIDRSAPNFLPA